MPQNEKEPIKQKIIQALARKDLAYLKALRLAVEDPQPQNAHFENAIHGLFVSDEVVLLRIANDRNEFKELLKEVLEAQINYHLQVANMTRVLQNAQNAITRLRDKLNQQPSPDTEKVQKPLKPG